MTDRRIYVASLSDYNAGRLHGAWIDATQDPDDIWEDVQAMLKQSKEPWAEEWAIHDFEGFEGYELSEWESFEDVSRIAQALDTYGPALGAWLSYDCDRKADVEGLRDFQESFHGEWDSEKQFAEEFTVDVGMLDQIPEHLRFYFDYDAYARDLFLGDYYSIRNQGKVYVFSSI